MGVADIITVRSLKSVVKCTPKTSGSIEGRSAGAGIALVSIAGPVIGTRFESESVFPRLGLIENSDFDDDSLIAFTEINTSPAIA